MVFKAPKKIRWAIVKTARSSLYESGSQTYAAVKIVIDKSPPLPPNNMMLSGRL